MSYFNFDKYKVCFNELGSGNAILLLHGYLEDKHVWGSFANELAKKYRVIMPDIPGHGCSSTMGDKHTMEQMANVFDNLRKYLNIDTWFVLGHSMGGYVALALASGFEQFVDGIVLFHSSLNTDTPEKKIARLTEIDKILSGQKQLIFENNITKMFANINTDKFKGSIKAIVERANNHHEPGVCALLRGMMERPCQRAFWANWQKPALIIFGKNDNYIDISTANNLAGINPGVMVEWLLLSGHMGFIEQPGDSVKIVCNFVDNAICHC